MKKIPLLFLGILILSACSTVDKDESDKKRIDANQSNESAIEKQNSEDLSAFTNTYVNKDLGFSIKYPTTWSLRGYKEWTGTQIMDGTLDKEVETIEGVIDLVFANTQEKFENIYEMPEGYQSVSVRIFKIESEKYDNGYREEFLPTLDYNERLDNTEITNYPVNDKVLTLYVYETEGSSEAPSVLMAQAFYKGKNYAYSFGIDQENYRDKEEARRIVEQYLKPMLSTFEDLGGEIDVDADPKISDLETSFANEVSTPTFNSSSELSTLDSNVNLSFWDGYQWASNNAVSSFDVCQNEFGTGFAENGCNQYIKDNYAGSNTFNGYDCTEDCSGHEAGYEWAEDNDIQDTYNCEGNSDSFIEGCEAYVEENY